MGSSISQIRLVTVGANYDLFSGVSILWHTFWKMTPQYAHLEKIGKDC